MTAAVRAFAAEGYSVRNAAPSTDRAGNSSTNAEMPFVDVPICCSVVLGRGSSCGLTRLPVDALRALTLVAAVFPGSRIESYRHLGGAQR